MLENFFEANIKVYTKRRLIFQGFLLAILMTFIIINLKDFINLILGPYDIENSEIAQINMLNAETSFLDADRDKDLNPIRYTHYASGLKYYFKVNDAKLLYGNINTDQNAMTLPNFSLYSTGNGHYSIVLLNETAIFVKHDSQELNLQKIQGIIRPIQYDLYNMFFSLNESETIVPSKFMIDTTENFLINLKSEVALSFICLAVMLFFIVRNLLILKDYKKSGVYKKLYKMGEEHKIIQSINENVGALDQKPKGRYIVTNDWFIVTSLFNMKVFRITAQDIVRSTYVHQMVKRHKKGLFTSFMPIALCFAVFIGVPVYYSHFDYFNIGKNYYTDGNYTQAISYFEKELRRDPDNQQSKYYLGLCYSNMSMPEQSYDYLIQVKSIDDPDILNFYLAQASFYLGKYEESIDYLDNIENLDDFAPEDRDVINTWKAYDYYYLDQPSEVLRLSEEMGTLVNNNTGLLNLLGLIKQDEGAYDEAYDMFEQAIETDPSYDSAHVNLLSLLLEQKDYEACIDKASYYIKKFPANIEIVYDMAYSYSCLGKYDEAIGVYLKYSDLEDFNRDLVYEYISADKLPEAEKCVDALFEKYPEDLSIKEIKKYVDFQKLPEAEKIVSYFRDNYLYFSETDKFDEKADLFIKNGDLSPGALEAFVNSVKVEDDIFTYILSGSNYTMYQDERDSESVSYRDLGDDMHLVAINTFNENTFYSFKNTMSFIADKENETLIIDLRNNLGGDEREASRIADLLLPECNAFYEIDRDGEMYTTYSGSNQMKFNKIYILINRYSASCSELLTLCLKKYLPNAVTIGGPSFGKGVGQVVFESGQYQYLLAIVNFYWNVKEQNIMGSRLTPDIAYNGDNLADIIDIIKSN